MFTTVQQVEAASTSQLVAFYNEYAEKAGKKVITKFSDRTTAIKRCTALLEEIQAGQEVADDSQVKVEGATGSDGEVAATEGQTEHAEDEANNEQDQAELEAELEREQQKSIAGLGALQMLANQLAKDRNAAPEGEQAVKPGSEGRKASPLASKSRASNALGVSASWSDPEVVAARLTRHGVLVEVDGASKEFRSVREAFRQHRLPDSKHIRFRLALKASKHETFEHNGKSYVFTLLENEE